MDGIVKGEPIRGMAWWAKLLIAISILVVAFLALAIVLGNSPDARERAKERDAISACREAESDSLQELSSRRATRAMCDQLEAVYRLKWGRSP